MRRFFALALALVALALPLTGCAAGCAPALPAAVIRSPLAFVPDASPAAMGYAQPASSMVPLAPQAGASAFCAPSSFGWAPPPPQAAGAPCIP